MRRLTGIDPAFTYYVLKCGHAFLFTMVTSVALIFQTSEAGLSPIQLLLVGAGLQGAILVSETPTGVIADTYGRRRSVLIGLLLVGGGAMISGSVAEFAPILLGNMVWGFGTTFISGAAEAWIADEVGIDRANRVYLRSAQLTKFFWVAAIPVSIGIATQDLNLPILLAGALFMLLSVFLFLTMPETAFQRPAPGEMRQAWQGIGATLAETRSLVRGRPLLVTILTIMAFYGMAGQGFERLWVAHFLENQTFPGLSSLGSHLSMEQAQVVWFGVIRMAAAFLSIAAVEGIRRWVADSMTNHTAVTRTLFWINSLQMLSILGMAVAGDFVVAAACFCAAVALAECYDPLYLAWINQNVESRVRATVISMSSQFEAFGKTAGGPMIGVVASVLTLRSALAVAGIAILPALLFYFRAFNQGPQPAERESENIS
jgi:DHA3 family tetracycline resistance protein-like MFS transporter